MKQVREVPALPPRAPDAHKGDFGRVAIFAGSADMLGAAVLCARAALRGGAGLVSVGLPPPLRSLLPLAVPEATTFARDAHGVPAGIAAASAVVAGPGLGAGDSTRELLRGLLPAVRVPLVLDADALNALAPLAQPIAAGGGLVTTPHPGEAARLLGSDTASVQRDRLAAVTALQARAGGVAVLKGAATLVCDGERVYTNDTGNPGMATAGAGDVLAGLLGALLARGVAPFEAACLAVKVHGAAGDLAAGECGQNGLLASDLIDRLPRVLR